jgi:hypothetical protein
MYASCDRGSTTLKSAVQIGDAEREASLENGQVLVGFQTEDGGTDSVAVRIR